MQAMKKAPEMLEHQQGKKENCPFKNIMNSEIFQVGVGFLFGICTSTAIDVASQRSGTVGGEALLLVIVAAMTIIKLGGRSNEKIL